MNNENGRCALKCLVVDDHLLSQKLLEKQLHLLGFSEVRTVSDGKEGLQALAEDHYDIVFFDWAMPVMDGMEFIKKCKTQQELEHIAFVLVSSEAQPDRIMELLSVGASSYLTKPVTIEDLQHKVDHIINAMGQK